MLIFISIFTFLTSNEDPVLSTIYDQAIKRGIPENYLQQTFNKKHITVHDKIPALFARPYEKKAWNEYKKIFVTEKRINGGIKITMEIIIIIKTDKYRIIVVKLISFCLRYCSIPTIK